MFRSWSDALCLVPIMVTSCGNDWVGVQTPYLEFEMREVVETAQFFESESHSKPEQRVPGACRGAEFRTEKVSATGERSVTFAWGSSRDALEQCARSVKTSDVDVTLMKVGTDYRTFSVRPNSVLTGRDVVRARIKKRDEMIGVELEISASARKRVREFTKQHIGDRMAIMLDHFVVSAPVVLALVDSSSLVITVPDENEAKSLVKKLTGT